MRNPVMIGERVYLRPLETSDAEVMADQEAGETETFFARGRMLSSPIAIARGISEGYARQPPSEIAFAVCLIADDRLIGEVDLESIDYVNRTAETGSWIGPVEYRGQGYGTEAKHLLLEYCFDHLQLHVLHSWVREENTRSAAALLKQGYRPAGRLKWISVQQGVYSDALWFDITRDEWLAARERWRAARAAERSSDGSQA